MTNAKQVIEAVLAGKPVRDAVVEAVDKDTASALRPRGIKKAEPMVAAPKPEPKQRTDPGLQKRAMDWSKYNRQNPDEGPQVKMQKALATFERHGFRSMGSARPGVISFAHPAHPTHVVHYLSGDRRPEGSPDHSWYHHDNAIPPVGHNSGMDPESLDTHLGQFFGTGPEHHHEARSRTRRAT